MEHHHEGSRAESMALESEGVVEPSAFSASQGCTASSATLTMQEPDIETGRIDSWWVCAGASRMRIPG